MYQKFFGQGGVTGPQFLLVFGELGTIIFSPFDLGMDRVKFQTKKKKKNQKKYKNNMTHLNPGHPFMERQFQYIGKNVRGKTIGILKK